MSAQNDKLYSLFEQHLSGVLDESTSPTDLVEKVVTEYLQTLAYQGYFTPPKLHESLVEELRDEVMGMYRKKTYGFLTLHEYKTTKRNQ